VSDVQSLPRVVTVEPAGGRHRLRATTWLPASIYRELGDPVRYPTGAYPLYRLLVQAAETGIPEFQFRALVAQWRERPTSRDSVPCLRDVRAVAESEAALACNGLLQREPADDGEHWTVMLPDDFALRGLGKNK
jgi:hypothetical protein